MWGEPMYRTFGSAATVVTGARPLPASFAVGSDATLAVDPTPMSSRERALLEVGGKLVLEVGTLVGLAYLETASAGTATPFVVPRIAWSALQIYALVHRVQELLMVAIVAESDIPKITRTFDQIGLSGRATWAALNVAGALTHYVEPSKPSTESFGKLIDSVTAFTEALSEFQAQPRSPSAVWGVMTEAKNVVDRWNDYSEHLIERERINGDRRIGNTLGLRLIDGDPLAKYRDHDYPLLDAPQSVAPDGDDDPIDHRDLL